jgi:hypothetical protein
LGKIVSTKNNNPGGSCHEKNNTVHIRLAKEELEVMLDAFVKMLPAPLKKRLIPES